MRASRGEAITEELLLRRADTGEDIFVRASAAPIRRDGRIVGAVLVNSDITARRRLEARTQELLEREQRALADATLLAEASERLSASLDYEETMQNVARMALPRLGDSCVVTLARRGRAGAARGARARRSRRGAAPARGGRGEPATREAGAAPPARPHAAAAGVARTGHGDDRVRRVPAPGGRASTSPTTRRSARSWRGAPRRPSRTPACTGTRAS